MNGWINDESFLIKMSSPAMELGSPQYYDKINFLFFNEHHTNSDILTP